MEIKNNETRVCPHCGAPLLSEVCQYCGNVSDLSTEKITGEYPMVECKNATLTRSNTLLPLVIVFGGLLFPIGIMIALITSNEIKMSIISGLFLIPISCFGVVFLIRVLKQIYAHLLVKFFGKQIVGTVYGYMEDDMVLYNDIHGYKVKVLVDTKDDKRFLLVPLHMHSKPYPINKKVTMNAYKNCVSIMQNKVSTEIEWE